MFDRLKEDIACIRERDPAAKSALEVMLLYPGFKAVRSHRKANWLYTHGYFFAARFVSQRCAHKTGIEIHPGATIGRRFFIDHGRGVVIGETAEIGDDVTIGHNVTLHGCTVKNCALIGMGATVLDHAVIGEGAIIAAGALVLSNTQVGDGELWGGVPAKFIKKVDPEQAKELNQGIASHYIMYKDWYKE